MNTISITKDDAAKFRLPKKAIANWIVEKVESDFATLHRQKEDGLPASDFPKNTYKLFADVFNEIYKAKGETFPKIEPSAEGKQETLEERIAKGYNVGTRKSRWLVQLLTQFRADGIGKQVLAKIGGELKFIERVISDTTTNDDHKVAYSSLASAMRVWEVRLRRGTM